MLNFVLQKIGKTDYMQADENFKSSKKINVAKTIVISTIYICIISIAAFYVNNKNTEKAIGKDIIRCIIDENAANLNSPACKRVMSNCSSNNTAFCKKLLFYSDDGVHSDDALSMLGNICSKGGEAACDIIINRCIENNANCEILDKPYSIKNYLSMKAETKNTGKIVMYKKIKKYYEKDVDNIVNSVINTCLDDKNSMACEIFTSKIYEFNALDKPYFVINQNQNGKIEFAETGIKLAIISNKQENNVNNEKIYYSSSTEEQENSTETKFSESLQNAQTKNPVQTVNKEKILIINNENNVFDENIDNISKEDQSNKNIKQAVIKAYMATGEENNIDCIKSKIYSFDVVYKEPTNTKIKWLVSFDNKTSWKRWDGKSWIVADMDSELKNINFSKLGNNTTEIKKGLKNCVLNIGESSLDFAVELITSDENSIPSIDKIEVKYY